MPDQELVDQVAHIVTTSSDSEARDKIDGLIKEHGPDAVLAAAQHVQGAIRQH